MVIIGNILAWPIAYYAINMCLGSFAYHTELSWWLFALSAVLSIAVVIITIAINRIKQQLKILLRAYGMSSFDF
ncbi:MAG: hypothetical protein GQ564_10190 [Bacteroidales bacterium]|nr:hypothetical protein [Bacteroidales bacterium]